MKFVCLIVGRKDAIYYHRFIVWDKSWNIVSYSNEFNIMDGDVEFCIGLAKKDNNLLMSFGFQDNAAYLLEFPISILTEMLNKKVDLV
jgi:hypothetical protein